MNANADYAPSDYRNSLIETNAAPAGSVRRQAHVGPAQREHLRGSVRNRKRREGPADSPLLLWSGAEIVKPQLSSADLQFLENRKFSRAEICAAFGVPEEILTTTDKAKFDVMQGARLNFIENRVAPLCSRLEAEEEKTVRAINPRAAGWFDIDCLPIMHIAGLNR